MNWYIKINQVLTEQTELDLLNQLPPNCKIIKEPVGGWSVIDPNGNKIVYNESTPEMAVKGALPRLRYLDILARIDSILRKKSSI